MAPGYRPRSIAPERRATAGDAGSATPPRYPPAVPSSYRLGPEARAAALSRLETDRFDVAVIGGGITGVGCALDAAARGLSVVLLERDDLAAGTSSRSTKLIHGGLRYLQMLDLRLVREALRERGLLARLAPHLVRPLPFVYPLRRWWERPYVGAGVALYDALAVAGADALPHHRHLGRRRLRDLAPGLRPGLTGGVHYHDAEVDDARFVVAVARTAASHGATILTRARVTGFRRDGSRRIAGLVVTTPEGVVGVRARVVINATGVWSDEVERLAGDEERDVVASMGVHVVLEAEAVDATTGIITRTEKSVLFLVPFQGRWLLGTTDTPYEGDPTRPRARSEDVSYLLERAARLLAEPPGREEIVGVFAGLRPLVAGDAAQTERLSREHAVLRPVPGLVTITGGKYTTYRVMARDAVDAAVDDFWPSPPASSTAGIPIHGADGFDAAWAARHHLARERGWPVSRAEHLLWRYGAATDEVVALVDGDPSLGEELPQGRGHLRAEAVHGVTHEGATDLVDLLARRMRLAITARDGGIRAAEAAAEVVAPVLQWTAQRAANEVERYRRWVAAERAALR